MPSILIIDDDQGIRTALLYHFRSQGWDAAEAENGRLGLTLAEKFSPDIILLDMKLPDGNGLELLRSLKATDCSASIVIMTGWGSIANAVEAIKLGAEQYLPKPLSLEELNSLMGRILETRKIRIENVYYRRLLDHPIVGVSMETQKLHHLVDLMAENADTTALLLGESGTGKELVAREIHRRSVRSERPFLDINCAVLSETLLESEMFGHERGAFTDAHERKPGLFEVADGGTVLLDEIGEMPLPVQPKLLRVLETRTFRRVGGTRDIPVNIRLIAATNRDLEKAVAAGRFREDLYYRLHVFPIQLPPLRERPADIPVLLEYFLDHFRATLKKKCTGFTPRAGELMTAYAWPGNVRELKNIIERAMVLSKGAEIDIDMLPREILGKRYEGRDAIPEPTGDGVPGKTLEAFEREHILSVLRAESNNRTTAARVLGISRSTLQEKLKKYGMTGR